MGSSGTIERAYALARSGECRTLSELRIRLRRENYEQVDFHLSGRLIKDQLRTLMKERR